MPLIDGLQNEAGNEFGGVALGVIGGGPAAGRISHSVPAKVRRRDERVDFTDDNPVLLQLGACRQAESKKRTLRRRVNAVLRNRHEGSPRIDVHDAPAALRPHQWDHGLHRHDRSQHIETEDLFKQSGIDFLDRRRITATCIVYQPVHAAVVPVHGADGFPHLFKLRHIRGDRKAARKAPGKFFQRSGAASEQGDSRAAIRQRGGGRQPNPGGGARDNEYVILDLHCSNLRLQRFAAFCINAWARVTPLAHFASNNLTAPGYRPAALCAEPAHRRSGSNGGHRSSDARCDRSLRPACRPGAGPWPVAG